MSCLVKQMQLAIQLSVYSQNTVVACTEDGMNLDASASESFPRKWSTCTRGSSQPRIGGVQGGIGMLGLGWMDPWTLIRDPESPGPATLAERDAGWLSDEFTGSTNAL